VTAESIPPKELIPRKGVHTHEAIKIPPLLREKVLLCTEKRGQESLLYITGGLASMYLMNKTGGRMKAFITRANLSS
jgi:hypothetical protein